MKHFDRDKIISWSILFIALLFRFADISLKPPHGDEGVNGHFVALMRENGYFSYDPTNYHGPLLFYLFQISEKIFGFGIHSFRIVTAFFSLLTIWLVLRCRDILGQYGSYFGALALAVSPGMIFFGRSAIHEPLFVFFQVLWIVGFLRLLEQIDQKGLQWFLFGIFGCALLKETFVILGISFVLAWLWLEFSHKIANIFVKKVEPPPVSKPAEFSIAYLMKILLVVMFIWLVLFTGFFQHMKGAKDFFVALAPWLKTGVGGAGHNKPFLHWISLFKQYEWVGIVGIVGAFAGIVSRSWKVRFLSFFALINGLIYSLIPYKTPWCVISILWPFVFIAGIWIEFIIKKYCTLRSKQQGQNSVIPACPESFRKDSRRAGMTPKNKHTNNGRSAVSAAGFLTVFLLSVAVAVLIGRSAYAAYELNFVHYANTSPYVYVQVKNDFKVLENIVLKKVQSGPNFQNMIIQSSLNESWPLPWVFSRFPNYRYGGPKDAFDLNADIILAEVSRKDQELSGLYVRRKIDLREAREHICIYLKKSFFKGIALPGFEEIPAPASGGR